jgi:hypothetical protein
VSFLPPPAGFTSFHFISFHFISFSTMLMLQRGASFQSVAAAQTQSIPFAHQTNQVGTVLLSFARLPASAPLRICCTFTNLGLLSWSPLVCYQSRLIPLLITGARQAMHAHLFRAELIQDGPQGAASAARPN